MSVTKLLSTSHLILETKNFYVVSSLKPHIDRADGGHIYIIVKNDTIFTLQDMPNNLISELFILAKIVGEAMLKVTNQSGIDVKLINYQINGNWSYFSDDRVNLHLHLYGRAVSAKKQKFGEGLFFPSPKTNFYKDNEGFNDKEIILLKSTIMQLLDSLPYKNLISFD